MPPACQLCGSVGGGLRKWSMALCPPFSLEESCPSALTLLLDTSAPPCMPLLPFKLLTQCWSSEVISLSKSICGFFKGNCLGFQKFILPTQSPPDFAARSYGDLSFWHWNPRLREWYGSGTPYS